MYRRTFFGEGATASTCALGATATAEGGSNGRGGGSEGGAGGDYQAHLVLRASDGVRGRERPHSGMMSSTGPSSSSSSATLVLPPATTSGGYGGGNGGGGGGCGRDGGGGGGGTEGLMRDLDLRARPGTKMATLLAKERRVRSGGVVDERGEKTDNPSVVLCVCVLCVCVCVVCVD